MDTGQVTRPEVPEAFDEVADRYDLMVGLSPGYHSQLRASADVLLDAVITARTGVVAGVDVGAPLRLLDLGCGSGASTRAVVAAVQHALRSPGQPPTAGLPGSTAVLAVDGSAGMLTSARSKTWPTWVSFAQGRAEHLAEQPELGQARAAGGLDGVLAAYLVRNVPDRDAVVSAIHDELRPGGVLVVHDYSVKGRPISTVVWTLMCWVIILPLGWLTSRRTRLYRYLWRSVLDMDSTAQLEQRLRRAGFVEVKTRHARGWQRGIVHSTSGRRPVVA